MSEAEREEQLREQTVEELHGRARELDIHGRSSMLKEDLVSAIAEAEEGEEPAPEATSEPAPETHPPPATAATPAPAPAPPPSSSMAPAAQRPPVQWKPIAIAIAATALVMRLFRR